VDLTFLGAAGTVTGSKYLLRGPSAAVLVDCGLFQGLKPLRLRNWAPLAVPPKDISTVVLTHAHLDHSGYLPLLVKKGFAGRVHATVSTAELCGILLPDCGHLQEEEARYANKRSFSKHKPALPLYTEEEAGASLKRLFPHRFGERFAPAGNIQAQLVPAGHILGAGIALLESQGRRVVFSGDLGRQNDALMRPPQAVEEADCLVVESTYGNRRHEAGDPEPALGAHLKRALDRGGVVVVPAFAVGRAQTLLHFIARLKARHAIPDVPVFLNSPMAVDALRLYHDHRAEHRLSVADCEAMCRVARIVNSADESKALNERKGPMVIVSASGMATGGRVVHHLKAFAPDPRNMILLPGFQAAGTRGAALAAGADQIKIHGEYVRVRAEVVKMDNLSAHADYTEILQWLRAFRRAPKRTFVTHGEPAAADEMRRRIEETLGWNVQVPELGETVRLA
jgi:metallo-beta-lactamase family protein